MAVKQLTGGAPRAGRLTSQGLPRHGKTSHFCPKYVAAQKAWIGQRCLRVVHQRQRTQVILGAALAEEVETPLEPEEGLSGFVPEWVKEVEEERPLPQPPAYQQTLARSFTVGGIGLHTAQESIVRVRPAFAGEGRYFVIVPPGTNSPRCEPTYPEEESEDDGEGDGEGGIPAEGVEGEDTARFLEYLNAQDGGYVGSFEEWCMDFYPGELVGADRLRDDYRAPDGERQDEEQEGSGEGEEGSGEAAEGRQEDYYEEIDAFDRKENHILCRLENMDPGDGLAMDLVQGDLRVKGVEHLLAALEASGVDNARIEIEGGEELPIHDGSSMAWVMHIHAAGLRVAPVQDGSAPCLPRALMRPTGAVSVTRGGSFVAFYPTDGAPEISCGVDHEVEAPVIGRQWYSWLVDTDDGYVFRSQIAPARTYVPSLKTLYDLRKRGYYRAGTVDQVLIGYGERWYENMLVRYEDTEPPRHKILDILGDLSLLAQKGNAGVPLGHIVAYNADHILHADFLRELQNAFEDAEVVIPEEPGMDDEEEEEEEEEDTE